MHVDVAGLAAVDRDLRILPFLSLASIRIAGNRVEIPHSCAMYW